MVEYLTLFDTHAEYLESKSGLTLPNVSSCLNDYAGHFNPLPYDYEVEYLEVDSAHTFCIKTNARMARGRGFGCTISDFWTKKDSSGWVPLMGTTHSSQRAIFYVNPTGNTCGLDWQNGNGGNMISTISGTSKQTIECKKKNNSVIGIYHNGTEKSTKSWFDFPDTTASDVFFLTTSTGCHYKLRLYRLFVYDTDGSYLFDAVPVVKDGVGYMYDKVSRQLFGNSGTGVFVLGSRKDEPLFDAEIEYLQGTTTTYIDTGINNLYLDNSDWEFYIETDVQLGTTVTSNMIKGHGYYDSKALFVGFTYQNARHIKVDETNTRYTTSGVVKVHIKCKNGKASCTINNSSILSNSARSSFTLPAFFLFGAANDNRTLNTNTKLTTLKASKSWLSVGGNMVFDYVPVRKGNVGYMYDKVTNQLFGNAGSGNFTLGPDKPFDYRTIYYGII